MMNSRAIGKGFYSSVWEVSGPNDSVPDFVIKVPHDGKETTDGWWQFADWVVQHNALHGQSPYLPRIIHLDRDAKVAVLGRLKWTMGKMLDTFNMGEDKNVQDAFIAQHFPACTDAGHVASLSRFFDCWGTSINSDYSRENYERKIAVYQPSEHVLGLFAFVKNVLLPARAKYGFMLTDLHMQNLMVDAQFNLVINDPSA